MNQFRFFSVFLAIYLLVMFWLPILVFKHQQHVVRKEMKTFIKNSVPEDQRLRFFADDLEADSKHLTWIHEKEFRYKNEMYDILSKEYIDGRLLYVCIHDVKESGLFAQLDKFVDKQMADNTPLKAQRKCLQQFVVSLFFQQTSLQMNVQYPSKILYSEFRPSFRSGFSLPETPPPEEYCVCNG